MAIVPPNNNTGLYNTSGVPATTGNDITVNGNVNANNLNAINTVNAGTNITAGGNITASGYFIGNGSLLTNINAGNISGNVANANYANTAGFATTAGSANTANTATFATTAGSANTANTATFATTAGSANTANSALTAGTVTTAAQPNITSVGTLTSLSVTGNIATSGYFLGDGSLLTNLPESYSNAKVSAYLASGTNTLDIITQGDVQGLNLKTSGSGGNIVGANYVSANVFSGYTGLDVTVLSDANIVLDPGGPYEVKTTSNVAAGGFKSDNYYYANGSPLVFGTYGNANVAAFLPTYTGNLAGGNANITNDLVVGGTIFGTFSGNISGNLVVPGSNTQVLFNNSGNAGASADFTFNDATNLLTVSGNVNATQFNGSGAGLTNLPGANVVGAVANATYATSAGTATSATTAGTVTTNAQPNITSVGTLTSLTSTGNVSGGNIVATGGGNVIGWELTSTSSSGSEGGQINLALPASGTSLSGGVTVDVYANQLRFFETGGTQRGAYIDLTAAAAGVGSNLLAGGSGTYGNANVAALLAAFGSNTIVTTGNISGGNLSATSVVYTPQVEATGDLDLNTTGRVNVNGNLRVGDNNQNTQIATHGTGDLILTTDQGSTTEGTIRLYNGASGNIDVTTNGTGKINLNGGVFTNDGITATGNITGLYILGNGSQLTGLPASYSNANVATFLAAFGSNTISTTGNITGGNFIGSGAALSSLTGANVTGTVANATYATSAGTASTADLASFVTGNAQANITSVGTLTSLTTTGKITSGAVTYANTDGTNGQVLTTYGNGVTYFSTVSGGSGSPGGANTQIQFNDGGSFAGNAAITFDKTSGNIGLGNLIVNTQQIQTTQSSNVGLTTSLTPNPGRVLLGTGYNGNTSAAFDQANNGRGSRFLITDTVNVTDANSIYRGIGVQNFHTLNSNVSGSNIRISGLSSAIQIGGGAGANTSSATTPFAFTGGTSALNIGGGTSGNLTGLGNTIIQAGSGSAAAISVNAGSTGGNIFGGVIAVNNFGTANTVIGTGMFFQQAGTYSGNVYGVYMPGGTSNYGISSSNNARNATNYHFLRNEDNHSYSQLGQLTRYQETEYALSSSAGAVTVDKNNGQVQFYTVSEAATMSFSNFVTSSTVSATTRYQTDTVTVIVQQDATGRTITLPAASSTYKYAGGTSTVPATANSVSMISITAIYNSVTAATQYLITISPEFT